MGRDRPNGASMMPGVAAGFPDVDLRLKTLTVGQGSGSATGHYGYNDSLIDANDYGYLSKSQVTVPAGSRITALRNVGSFRSVTLEISQSSPPVSDSEFFGGGGRFTRWQYGSVDG